MTHPPAVARDTVRALRASKIREVANAGMNRKDVLTFWFGEPDEVTPAFIRQAGIDALHAGETFYTQRLQAMPGIEAFAAPGAMYAFFRVDGVTDSLAFCKGLVAEVGLGLAPGIAFGPEGEGFVRWCFASGEARLADGADRLRKFLTRA